jgi:hypothetical protein
MIDAQGVLVWAVCQLLEKAGISVQIDVVYSTRGIDRASDYHALEVIRVKDASRYVAPSLLATVFSSNFFRRLGCAWEIASADRHYVRIKSSLGRAVAPESTEYKDGVINLSLGNLDGLERDNLQKALEKALQ